MRIIAVPVKDLSSAKRRLSAAIRQVEEESLAAGVATLAVVLADLPYLSPKGLASALQTLGPVVLAPATTDGGTNMLLRRPPRAIPPRFGRNSYQRHLDAAAAKDLPISTVTNREL